jgi:hypothetical protein
MRNVLTPNYIYVLEQRFDSTIFIIVGVFAMKFKLLVN